MGGVLMLSGWEYIVSKQIQWAKNNNIPLIGSKGERGRATYTVDLNQIAEGAISDLEIRIEKSGGKVVIDDLPVIEADPVQMRQLLVNLIGNALKFHKEGIPPVVKVYSQEWNGIENACESVICRELTEPSVYFWRRIYVEDNGIGFDEKYLDRIFQPFQRLHGRDEYEGCGIGLTTCRKIVERHQGQITAKSSLGKGAIFIVTLPVKHSLN